MIFCVEDDESIRNMMVYTLNSSGFSAMGLEDGNALFAAMEKELQCATQRLTVIRQNAAGEDEEVPLEDEE